MFIDQEKKEKYMCVCIQTGNELTLGEHILVII